MNRNKGFHLGALLAVILLVTVAFAETTPTAPPDSVERALLGLNATEPHNEELPDFGPEVFEKIMKYPKVLATYGKIPIIKIETQKRNWLDKLDEIMKGGRDKIDSYFYPAGPVVGYGYDYKGYIVVTFKDNSSKTLMDEINNIIYEQAMQKGVYEVPVVFESGDFPQLDTLLTEEEKAIEIAKNDPKIKVMLPDDSEVIAVDIPSFAKRNDRIYNVIFKHGEFHDIITVNLTSGKVEGAVSYRGEYQPKVEDLPMPVFREDVIVYFKEMPLSLEEFASRYGGKLIFAKPDVKMAAFETEPIGKPAQTSQRTLDFIEKVLKDSYVETAFKDEFMFISRDREYSTEPKVMYPEDMKDEYVPNKVIVGFWRSPPSLEEFASRYGGKLIYYEEVLMFAGFDVSNISEFINKVSTDPYVSSAHPDGIGRILGVSGDFGSISGDADTPKAPGFDAILAAGLLLPAVYMLKKRELNENK